MVNDRGQRCEREKACRDQGRRNQVQTGGSNEREELKFNWTQKINTEKKVKIDRK